MKSTLVIGASEDPSRYAWKAVVSLQQHGYPVIAYGKNEGQINSTSIETNWNPDWEVDTVTLYINPLVQEAYEEKIIALKPRRVIFNPGTENEEFIRDLAQHGIAGEMSCTLVLLSIGNY